MPMTFYLNERHISDNFYVKTLLSYHGWITQGSKFNNNVPRQISVYRRGHISCAWHYSASQYLYMGHRKQTCPNVFRGSIKIHPR